MTGPFKTTLRIKLLALLALSVGAAVLPFSAYTAKSLARGQRAAAWADLRNASALLQAHLDSQYLLYLTDQVANTLFWKETLRKIGALTSRNWEDLETFSVPQRGALIGHQIRRLGSLNLLVTTVRPGGDFSRPLGPFAGLNDWNGITDLASRNLRQLAENPNLAPTGEFVVFKAPRPGRAEPGHYLIHLIPSQHRRETIILLMDLEKIAAGRDQKGLNFVAAGLQARFRDLGHLQPGTSLSLLNGQGRTLAHYGPPPPAHPWPQLMPETRARNQLEMVLDRSAGAPPTIARLTWFKPLDAFLLLTIPEEAVSGPARAAAGRIIRLGGLVMALVLAAGAYFAGRLTGPLNLLSSKITDLARADFSRLEISAGLTEDLPVQRGDEVGRLARAFAQMGEALGRNVRDLMAATATKERLEGELEAARQIQMGLLPPPEAALALAESCRIDGFLQPAKEVGGDLYDFFLTPDGRLAVVIGDVSDKGVPAALFMAMTVTLVRQTLGSGLAPAEALTQINARLCANNPEAMFVTLFLGLFNPRTGELEYANGGHCQPLVAGGVPSPRRLEGLSGPMAGAWPNLEYAGFQARLEPGEICLLYTDGITEAQNEKNAFFGQERLEELFRGLAGADPADLNRSVYEAVAAFGGSADLNRDVYEAAAAFGGPARQSDDITLLSFRGRR